MCKVVVLIMMIIVLSGCNPIASSTAQDGLKQAKACEDNAKRVYHYYHDLEIYWDLKAKVYVVFDDGAWVKMPVRPVILTTDYPYVVIDDALDPWLNHSHYKDKYPF
ncbi:MAG: hypothetical protein GY858_09575 [Candidatus Omnitrophica bacterium]|nr:hypothetical protein [Candidatus Omnitrophota bacterium]